jgi:uncharacterized protein
MDPSPAPPAPAATPAAPTDSPGEPAPADLVPLDPRVRWLWMLAGIALVVQIAVPFLIVDLIGFLPLPRGVLTGAWLLAAGFVALAVPFVRYRRWRYAVRERDLWIRQGVLWVTVSVIPFSRLQFVDTRQGPLDRLFGLSQLVVHTAALGTSGRLPGLDAVTAERLRERLADVEPDAAGV